MGVGNERNIGRVDDVLIKPPSASKKGKYGAHNACLKGISEGIEPIGAGAEEHFFEGTERADRSGAPAVLTRIDFLEEELQKCPSFARKCRLKARASGLHI